MLAGGTLEVLLVDMPIPGSVANNNRLGHKAS